MSRVLCDLAGIMAAARCEMCINLVILIIIMLIFYADGPRNIQIKPQPIADKMGNVYGQDTTLTCSAAGNPSPTLTLTAVETDTGKPVDSLPMNKHDEVSVTLGADWLALTHTLTCTATNKPMTALGVREHVSSMAKVTFTVIHSK